MQESIIMSEGQTHVEPAALPNSAEPEVRARQVLTLLRSIQDCYRSLMKEKEAGGLNRAEMEGIDEAILGMPSGQRSLFSLLKRLIKQELVNNGGGSLLVELVGNVQSEKDWEILEAVVDALNPQQQQLDQQGATSAAAADETAAEPGVRTRRVLTLLRSIQECHCSLMKEKEAGGLNRAEMEGIDEAISGMPSGQRCLFSLLKRLINQELVNNGGGSLQVELVGNVQSEKDWEILEAIVDALNPAQQQLDQQGATSASAAAASADESPGPLRRWILDRGRVILTIFTQILDLRLEDFVFSAMSRLNPIQWLVRRRWDGETEEI